MIQLYSTLQQSRIKLNLFATSALDGSHDTRIAFVILYMKVNLVNRSKLYVRYTIYPMYKCACSGGFKVDLRRQTVILKIKRKQTMITYVHIQTSSDDECAPQVQHHFTNYAYLLKKLSTGSRKKIAIIMTHSFIRRTDSLRLTRICSF